MTHATAAPARDTPGRVEALPDPFVLGADDARRSPLHGRMVFVLGAEGAALGHRLDTLRAAPGTAVLRAPTGLCAGGLERPWSDFFWVDHMGPAVMAGAGEMLRALRGLADDLLAAAARRSGAHGAPRIVEWTPGHDAAIPAACLASLYPDAAFVRGGDPGGQTRPPGAAPNSAQGEPAGTARDPVEAVVARSPLRDRLIVVVGAPRSGTTWLEELFMAHPRVGGIAATETWLFEQLSDLWDNARLGACVSRHDVAAACRRYGDAVFGAALRRHAPRADFFVEKSPVHSRRIPQIAASYPDAWFVHIVRDGRDVARSAAQVPFFDLADPVAAAGMWQDFVRAARRGAPSATRYREVRYESLYADPVGHMRALFAWVGLGDDEAGPLDHAGAVGAAVLARSARRVSTHAGTSSTVGPGSWEALAPRALAGVYRRAGSLLVAEGYASARTVWRARLSPRAVARALGRRLRRRRPPRPGRARA